MHRNDDRLWAGFAEEVPRIEGSTVRTPRRHSFDVVEGSGRTYVQSMVGEPGRRLSSATMTLVLVAVVQYLTGLGDFIYGERKSA